MSYREMSNSDELNDSGLLISRICKICNQRKSADCFYHTSGGKNRRRKCKDCIAKYDRERRSSPNYSPPQRVHLRTRYGLTEDEFFKIIESQDGKCAICRTVLDTTTRQNVPKKAQVDHCHETEAVRGILCFSCNTGLGKFRDSVDLLGKAIDYLNNPPEVEYREKALTALELARAYKNNGKKRVFYDKMDIQPVERAQRRGFTEEEKSLIVEEYSKGGVSQEYLAVRWGVHQATISKLIVERRK